MIQAGVYRRALAARLIPNCFVAAKMATPGAGDERLAPGHFLPRVRAACCEHYFLAYYKLTGEKYSSDILPPLQGNTIGHSALNEAWSTFQILHMNGKELVLQPRPMQKPDFIKILHKYRKAFLDTRDCPSKSKKKIINLTASEWEELARELATPLQQNNNFVRFTSIGDAAEKKPRVHELKIKSGVGYALLHQELMIKFPDLQYAPEDRAVKLCPSTLKARRKLADVFAGRVPWLLLPREGDPLHRTRLGHHTLQQRENPGSQAPHQDDNTAYHEVYWDPEWMQFVFMMDATTFDNHVGEMTRKAPHVYYDIKEQWGPKEVTGNPPISQTVSIMSYSIIHPYLNLVVGPDIVYTGTKLKQSKEDKEVQMAKAGVKTWCEHYHMMLFAVLADLRMAVLILSDHKHPYAGELRWRSLENCRKWSSCMGIQPRLRGHIRCVIFITSYVSV